MTEDNIIIERKEKLVGTNFGIYFGTFAPFHKGHYSEMISAMTKNDGVVLIVSGYTGDRGDKEGLPLQRRFRYLREQFKDEPNVRVAMLDETNIPRYPDGWKPWAKDLYTIVKESIMLPNSSKHYNVYVGEQEYADYFNDNKDYYEEQEGFSLTPVLTDRSKINISGTKIREQPYANWDYIMPAFKRHFVKKVLVMGAASQGKTTMIRRLGLAFNAPNSVEYARKYEIESNITDDELNAGDYAHFIQGQYDLNSNAITSPANRGLALFDTDALVTRAYSKMYLKPEEHAILDPLFVDTIKREEVDMVLFIKGNTNYVDDGFRNMDWAKDTKDFENLLLSYLKEFNLEDKMVTIDGKTFNERYNQAYTAISNLVK